MRCCTLFILTIIACNYCLGMELEIPLLEKQSNRPCIYLVNGTTTAGKSAIACELEKILESRKQYSSLKKLALDEFFGSHLPLSFLWSITPAEMDEVKKKSHKALCLAAKAAYNQKLDVIIDTVVYKPEDVDIYKKELSGYQLKWVLAYCPIHTLIQRVIKRNEKSGITEQRSILQALDQFSNFYKNDSKNPIGQISSHAVIGACDIAKGQHHIGQGQNWWFINNIQNAICPSDIGTIQKSLLENLIASDDADVTEIGPSEPHDYVVDTSKHDSATCAQMIFDALMRN